MKNFLKYIKWAAIAFVIFIVLGIISFINDNIFEELPLGENLWFVIIIIGVVIWCIHLNKDKSARKLANQRAINRRIAIKKHRQDLAPANWTHWIKININSYDSHILGQTNQPINYMFTCSNNVTTFPESQYGNSKGYYVIDIQFQPHWISISNGTGNGNSSSQTSYNFNGSQNTFGGGAAGGLYNLGTSFGETGFVYGNHSNMNINGNSNSNGVFGLRTNSLTHRREVPTNAIVTLVTSDLNNSFKIKLMNVNSNFINYIRQYYLLDSIKKQKLGIK